MDLYWLTESDEFRAKVRALDAMGASAWTEAAALANTRLDFVRTNVLDRALQRATNDGILPDFGTKPIRLAILASSTMSHLLPAIRVAGLRRGIHITIYEAPYGQYWQEFSDPLSGLYSFQPNAILLALDAHHVAAGVGAALTQSDELAVEIETRIRQCWRSAKENFGCSVIHQTPLPIHPLLMGNNEHRLSGSQNRFVRRHNEKLRVMADAEGVDVLALDDRVVRDGLSAWHDPVLWNRAKQEVSPSAAPLYGDLVGRLLAAEQGRSYKCLVLDLDNTIWGGVVGDDGLNGLILGQGSALGEAFAAFQVYLRELSRRGVILAVCSKNDEAVALAPFADHPEMVLRRSDIAAFVANWSDKAANIRRIAQELAIGLDSLVFVDDNPFERALVRRELPSVAVPELGEDPTYYPRAISDGGYFESVAITEDDRGRVAQYRTNQDRAALKASTTDLASYLRSLEMKLDWQPFDLLNLARIVQLINKTNQFNLTTYRYGEENVLAVMRDDTAFGLTFRLTDRFGDNGIIAIVIGRALADAALAIDSWLMSCRVLGRGVEEATLNVVAAQARRLGAKRLVGKYVPTERNEMVKNHYQKLGFHTVSVHEDGSVVSSIELDQYNDHPTSIVVGTRCHD